MHEARRHVGGVLSENGLETTTGCQQVRAGGSNPTGHSQLNPAKDHMNLGADGSRVELLDEMLALGDTLVAASGEILKQRTRLSCVQILCENKCLLFLVPKCVAICSAAVANKYTVLWFYLCDSPLHRTAV